MRCRIDAGFSALTSDYEITGRKLNGVEDVKGVNRRL
jgi:hypothetical protein